MDLLSGQLVSVFKELNERQKHGDTQEGQEGAQWLYLKSFFLFLLLFCHLPRLSGCGQNISAKDVHAEVHFKREIKQRLSVL